MTKRNSAAFGGGDRSVPKALIYVNELEGLRRLRYLVVAADGGLAHSDHASLRDGGFRMTRKRRPLLTLTQAQYFVALAEDPHFTVAGQRLGVSQQTISASIRGMEKAVGTVLFRRTPRAVDMTEQGELLLPFARELVESAERLDLEAQNLSGRRLKRSGSPIPRPPVTRSCPPCFGRLAPSGQIWTSGPARCGPPSSRHRCATDEWT